MDQKSLKFVNFAKLHLLFKVLIISQKTLTLNHETNQIFFRIMRLNLPFNLLTFTCYQKIKLHGYSKSELI